MTECEMRDAVRRRDAAADEKFFYAVVSTGVFCFPSCAARAARPENMRFFATRDEALRQDYRPCRRCRPDLSSRAEREAAAIEAACRAIEAGCFDQAEAAEAAGMSNAHFARIFRRICGVSVGAYKAARRQRVAQAALQGGAPVTDALYEAGFGSSGRFYEAADAMLGMTPTAWRAGGKGETLLCACADSWLGRVLVAGTARGICAILIGETDAELRADLVRRFPRAAITAAEAGFAALVAQVVGLIEAPDSRHDLPLDIRGTVFQRRVWQALRDIPPGETQSYGRLAARLGVPKGARAVAGACAANPLAVAVPCHRVVSGAGKISGYRWGPARKRAILAREAGTVSPIAYEKLGG
jgi:AraC family transcriptional regulator of adaptative response/methylated-DNA-[protein]-cysteine methyltransferase